MLFEETNWAWKHGQCVHRFSCKICKLQVVLDFLREKDQNNVYIVFSNNTYWSDWRIFLMIHLVQEPRAVYLKWMSTSGNEFEERKRFVVCENLILKMILYHNAFNFINSFKVKIQGRISKIPVNVFINFTQMRF